MTDYVKIWSYEHDAWWRANSQGYTIIDDEAGLYLRSEAEKIVKDANYGNKLNEDIVEINIPTLKEQIALLIREINSQDNRSTASPYYYVVQSKKWVDTVFDGDKTVIFDEGLYTLDEWLALGEDYTEESFEEKSPFQVREEWEDREIFLTEKAALLYMRANSHHLKEPRTYIKHFWRNSQMKTVMQALEEFSGEKIKWR